MKGSVGLPPPRGDLLGHSGELNVTARLSGFLKARCFEFAFDLVERQRASCGLDVYFDITHARYDRGDRRCEVKFESVSQVIESLIFRRTLARNVNLHALGYVPLAFLRDAGGE